ncbi:MAG: hypothetical protein EZS28_014538 [Streblomastix strix]|uniref:Uncharacterized protein n=1 Tax=Streblomastix strix TaxID=222440 RepID=A0A5J4W4U3_9EUKA|nr:MAG: hypothetical protein EZS28_014538 [Streblomastix strix]
MKQANFFVGISSSILVLRGGAEFVQYQKKFSNTVIHVDTGHCLAAVQVAADEDPLTFTLRTWFKERSYKHTLDQPQKAESFQSQVIVMQYPEAHDKRSKQEGEFENLRIALSPEFVLAIDYTRAAIESAGLVLPLVAKNQKEFEVDILKDGQPHKIELLAQTRCEVDDQAVLLRDANIRSRTASVALQHNILSAKSPALPYILQTKYHLLKNTSENSLLSDSQEVEDEKTYSCGSELNERTGQLSKVLEFQLGCDQFELQIGLI